MGKIFGENLRRLRKTANLTQEELAYKLSVTPQAVSSWERGRTEPNMGQTENICRVLGCDMADLLRNTYRPITPEHRRLIDLYEDAPQNVKDAIRSLLGMGEEKKTYMQIKWYEDTKR